MKAVCLNFVVKPLHKEDEEEDESCSEGEEAAKDLGDSTRMLRGDSLRASKISNYDTLSSTDMDLSIRIKNKVSQ